MATISSLDNHLLIAMPSLNDPNFERTVVYVCEHRDEGAVGLVINRPMQFSLSLVFDQMEIKTALPEKSELPLMFGGPIQPERGFVVHKQLGTWRSSLLLQDGVTVTTSSDIIHAIAAGNGPQDLLVTLGYSGWVKNQLEQEIMDNFWLVCPYEPAILYEIPFKDRWDYAGSLLGVKMNQLSTNIGHA